MDDGTPLITVSANTCWYIHNFRARLIRAFLDRGWKVSVLAPRDEYTDRVVELGAGFREVSFSARGTNPVREAGVVLAFLRAYRALRPSVALHYTMKPNVYGSLAARMLHVPVINNVSGLGTMFTGGWREKLARALYRPAFARADLVFFQNPDDRELFRAASLVDQERARLLPGSGVDTERFAPRPKDGGAFTFLLAARLLREKGVEEYLAAARLLRGHRVQPRFVLLGRHDPADPQCVDGAVLEAAVREGVVEMPGHTDDVRPFIAAADCVVLPSYYREGVPRSLLEAASMGRPIIAADSVGTREPVRDGLNGYLCRPRDPGDLAAKMKTMMESTPAARASMGEASRRIATESFDERVVLGAYLEAVGGILSRAGGAA
jgi:glycosyltransferase involved in cell wall biosynthesis